MMEEKVLSRQDKKIEVLKMLLTKYCNCHYFQDRIKGILDSQMNLKKYALT